MAETREPRPGDVIWANRIVKGLPYNHCGVYEGGGQVIHFAAPKGSEISQENAVVHRTSIDRFADGCPVKIIDYPEGYSSGETLRRARSRIGEKGYDFLINNCDHFATKCKTGEHRSLQVDTAKNVIRVVSRTVGGPVGIAGEMICSAHDIAENFKAPKLDGIDRIKKPRGILNRLDLNMDITDHIIPAPEEESPEEEIPFDEELPFRKPPLYERIGEKLKGWTYPIAGALEILKRLGKLPPVMRNIDYNTLGARVRNGIDGIVTAIKVVTGKFTPQEAVKENKNNETALLGQQIARERKQPVKEALKQAFGGAGTLVKQAARQAAAAFVPAPVRQVFRTGLETIGRTVVSGFKTAAARTVNTGRTVVGKVASFLGFGRK